jgi:hypothetical protein
MEEIKCECSDEILEIKDLHIEDNSFSDGFGTVIDVNVLCPNCGAKFDGIECYACGFDATEIDIY